MALKQALSPEFRVYQRQVVANCKALARTLTELGYKIVTGISKNWGGTTDWGRGPLPGVARSLTPRFIHQCGCRVVALAWWLQLGYELRPPPEELVCPCGLPLPYMVTAASLAGRDDGSGSCICHLAGEAERGA